MSKRPSRPIAIHGSPIGLMVFPPEPFTPFPVPQFPLSQLQWLDHLSELMLKAQQRCVVASLMLDVQQQKWVRPHIPTQRCGRDGVCWSHSDSDYADRIPTHLIGGSHQSASARSLDEAVSLVPAVDGVYLINVHAEKSHVYAFVYHDGQAHAVDATQFLMDDVAHMLAMCSEQLVIA